MTLNRVVNRPVRGVAAAAGVVGAFALTGCAGAQAEPGDTDAGPASPPAYADGSYTATGSYQTPESVEDVTVTVTLADDVVTAVEVTGTPTKPESEQYQSRFIGGIAEEVVGRDIDELSVSRVAGSSLTSTGFNMAIDEIKSEAAA